MDNKSGFSLKCLCAMLAITLTLPQLCLAQEISDAKAGIGIQTAQEIKPHQVQPRQEAAPKAQEAPNAAQEKPKSQEQPKTQEQQVKEAPKAAEQPVKEAPKAAEQPVKEAPKAAEQPVKEAPKAAEQPVKEAPKAAEQPVQEAPKAAEQPVQEAPKAAEQPVQEAPSVELDAPDLSQSLIAPVMPSYLPIIMYHQISRESNRLGAYVISEEEFESDLKLLKENGYTTVTIKDLLQYVNKIGGLPDKPVMLTFDDGFQSDYTYALPILKKYKMKAIFSIIGQYTEENSDPKVPRHINYAHLSWDEIREMKATGLAEFQCHTYDMHDMSKRKGALKKWNESKEEYRANILEDLKKLSEACKKNIGESPQAFTCPFGCYSDQLGEIIKEFGLPAIMHSYQKMNVLTGNPEELYILKRFLRVHNKNVEDWIGSWNELFKEPVDPLKADKIKP